MELAVHRIHGHDLKIFNKVRLYLRIATISDLATANGVSVDKDIFDGRLGTSPTPSRHAYKWPNVPEPTPSESRKWLESLCRVLQIDRGTRRLVYTNYRHFENEAKAAVGWNLDGATSSIFQRLPEGGGVRWATQPIQPNIRATRQTSTYYCTNERIDERRSSFQRRWALSSKLIHCPLLSLHLLE